MSTLALASAIGALIVPGLGLELALVPGAPGPLVRGVRGFLLSLAFWPVAIFATRFTPLGLGGLAWGGLGLGGALAVAAGIRNRRPAAARGGSWAMLAGFAVVSALPLLALRSWIVAPGSDMSMHTFMARLVLEAGRLPSSYEPLYPIADFGSYAAGFPAIAAVLSRLSGAAVHRTSLALALLSYPALAGGLFLVARRFGSDAAALLAGVVVVATCGAIDVLSWGGNPTVLSLALGLAAIAPVLGDPSAIRTEGGRAFPVLLAAAGLVHAIPVLGLAWATPAAALLWIAGRPRGERARLLVRWLGLLAAAAVLLAVPYAFGTHPAVSAREQAWAISWQRETPHAYRGTWVDFPVTIWRYLWTRFSGWNGLAVAALGGAAAAVAPDRRLRPWAAFAAGALLLVLNSRYWILPGSAALYPERMAMLLYAPLSALLAVFLDELARRLGGRSALARRAALAAVATAALAWAGEHASWRVRFAGRYVQVTQDDLEVVRWAGDHLPPGAVVANRRGDAGAWIPALALRAVTAPHTNPLYFDEIEAWARDARPGYAFLGEKVVYPGPAPDPLDAVRAAPDRFQEIFSRGGAALFEVRAGAASPRSGADGAAPP